MIIGLSGYAQSGKDTIGAALVKNYGFTRYAFADSLKEMVYRLNPIAIYNSSERVQSLVDGFGWEEAKKMPEIRRLLQVMGTEAGRQVLGENIWVDAVMYKAQHDENVVITDCRFPNEAQAIVDQGGFMVRVVRPGVGAVNAHPSETSLDDWDFNVTTINAGSLDDIDEVADGLYSALESSQ